MCQNTPGKMVISWDIFPFRFTAVLGKKTSRFKTEFSALELCSKHAWGDICGKVSGNMPWNISKDSLNCVANYEKAKTAFSGTKINLQNCGTVIALILN